MVIVDSGDFAKNKNCPPQPSTRQKGMDWVCAKPKKDCRLYWGLGLGNPPHKEFDKMMLVFGNILPLLLILPIGQKESANPPSLNSVPTLPSEYDPAKIEKYVQAVFKAKGFIGLEMLVVRKGKPSLSVVAGTKSLLGDNPVQSDTPFAIGSLSKQFTCAAIFLLAQEGKLSPMDKVAKWYPKLTNANRITLLDLMNHTSGYSDYYPLDFVDRRMAKSIELDDLIQQYAGGKVDFEPGEKYSYSNTGFTILGRVVEKVSGLSLGDFLKKRIFVPLEMKSARLDPPQDLPDWVKGYRAFGIETHEWAPPEGKGWLHGAGGIWASANDLGKWAIGLMSGKVLEPKSMELMTRARILNNGKKRYYGCGLSVNERDGEVIWAHGGAVSGFHATISMMPRTQSAVILLVNSEHLDDSIIHRDVMNLMLKEPSSLPTINGPKPVDSAKILVSQLAKGTLDTKQLGEEFGLYMTPKRLEAYATRLKELGDPIGFEVESTYERGGMEVAMLRIVFKKGNSLKASLYRTPDGIVQQFLLTPH